MEKLNILPRIVQVGNETIIELWQDDMLVSKIEFNSKFIGEVEVYINDVYAGRSNKFSDGLEWFPIKR